MTTSLTPPQSTSTVEAAPLEQPSALCSCLDSPGSYSDSQQPLTSRTHLDLRVRQLIPTAIERQLWLLFLDADDVQLPLLMPIGELGAFPWSFGGASAAADSDGAADSDAGAESDAEDTPASTSIAALAASTGPRSVIHDMLASLAREIAVSSFVFVLERPGGDILDLSDAEWIREILDVPDGADYRVRAVYLAHDGGPGGFEVCDREHLSAGDVVPTVRLGCLGVCDEIEESEVTEVAESGHAA